MPGRERIIEKEIWGEKLKRKIKEREKGYKMERERMRDRYGKRERVGQRKREIYIRERKRVSEWVKER